MQLVVTFLTMSKRRASRPLQSGSEQVSEPVARLMKAAFAGFWILLASMVTGFSSGLWLGQYSPADKS